MGVGGWRWEGFCRSVDVFDGEIEVRRVGWAGVCVWGGDLIRLDGDLGGSLSRGFSAGGFSSTVDGWL